MAKKVQPSAKEMARKERLANNDYAWSAPPGSYVDVRGVHPTFIDGLLAVSLEGAPRDISVDEAWWRVRDLTGMLNFPTMAGIG